MSATHKAIYYDFLDDPVDDEEFYQSSMVVKERVRKKLLEDDLLAYAYVMDLHSKSVIWLRKEYQVVEQPAEADVVRALFHYDEDLGGPDINAIEPDHHKFVKKREVDHE